MVYGMVEDSFMDHMKGAGTDIKDGSLIIPLLRHSEDHYLFVFATGQSPKYEMSLLEWTTRFNKNNNNHDDVGSLAPVRCFSSFTGTSTRRHRLLSDASSR